MTHLVTAGQFVLSHPVGILFALLATYFIGSMWHGPLFGKQWLELNKIPMPKKEDMKWTMMLPGLTANFFLVIVEFAVLGLILQTLVPSNIGDALIISAMLWLPFNALLLTNIYAWGGKPTKLIVLDTGHALVSMLAVAAIVFYTL